MPLTAIGLPQCSLWTSFDLAVPITLGSAGIAAGYGYVDLPLPVKSTGLIPLHGQWFVPGSGPTAPGGVTSALGWRH